MRKGVSDDAAASSAYEKKPDVDRRSINAKVLTAIQAREIFIKRPKDFSQRSDLEIRLAETYQVSIKTINDIWEGRTWYKETFDLDAEKPISYERLSKRKGRPKGSKDLKPRKAKVLVDISSFQPDHNPQTKPVMNHKQSKREARSLHILETAASGTVERTAQKPRAAVGTDFSAATPMTNSQAKENPTRQSRAPDELQAIDDPFHDDWPHWSRASQRRSRNEDAP